jgi:hypothetical protein
VCVCVSIKKTLLINSVSDYTVLRKSTGRRVAAAAGEWEVKA